MIPWLPTLALLAAPAAPLDIQADRLELDQRAGTARFEGRVSATQEGAFELRCDRLIVHYSDQGTLLRVEASGQVRVRQPGKAELTATAQSATWDRATGEITLRGHPEVRRGRDRLRGEVVRFWPEQQRVVIDAARGSISIPEPAARAAASSEARP